MKMVHETFFLLFVRAHCASAAAGVTVERPGQGGRGAFKSWCDGGQGSVDDVLLKWAHLTFQAGHYSWNMKFSTHVWTNIRIRIKSDSPAAHRHTHSLTFLTGVSENSEVQVIMSQSAHRLIVADRVQLSAEHNGCEGEEEESFHAEEDHQHHRHWRREIAALWTQKTTDGHKSSRLSLKCPEGKTFWLQSDWRLKILKPTKHLKTVTCFTLLTERTLTSAAWQKGNRIKERIKFESHLSTGLWCRWWSGTHREPERDRR